MPRFLVVLFVALLTLPGLAWAQDGAGVPAEETTAKVDVSKMGVSLDRIRRDLMPDATERRGGGPLNLQIHVEVFGKAPKIDFLEGFSVTGAIPYGSPTHQEVLDVITPREFRSPAVPVSAIFMQAAQYFWEKSKKSRCEQEIAEYRALVMQGVNIAPPRCTQ